MLLNHLNNFNEDKPFSTLSISTNFATFLFVLYLKYVIMGSILSQFSWL